MVIKACRFGVARGAACVPRDVKKLKLAPLPRWELLASLVKILMPAAYCVKTLNSFSDPVPHGADTHKGFETDTFKFPGRLTPSPAAGVGVTPNNPPPTVVESTSATEAKFAVISCEAPEIVSPVAEKHTGPLPPAG
jgi:hypothetical protein